jgi:7,8-dihydropterin-6-yl-methyl-4-(beta-D-ribofuranosyl)aminobenzene 5'-phosphate synthase
MGETLMLQDLEPVDSVRLTVLVDNLTDPLLLDEGPIARNNWPKALRADAPRLIAPAVGTEVPDPLLGEPGFSVLVSVEKGGTRRTILFDTGVTPTGMVENMRRLGLSLGDIEVIVLSHGHWDHVTGMEGVAKVLGRTRLPVLIHPEFWGNRRIRFPNIEPAEIPSPSRSSLEDAGFEITEERRPSFILDGSVLVTGEVDRTTEYEKGFPGHEVRRDSVWEPDPLILDDQAIVMRLRDRGLVVLTGCGHSGVVNVARYAQRLTGEKKIAAIVGGFHLNGPAFEPIIEPTVRAFDELAPEILMPAHCTGWKAVHHFARRFPDAFVQCAVGTSVTL